MSLSTVLLLAAPNAAADVTVQPDKYKPDLYLEAKTATGSKKVTPTVRSRDERAMDIDPIDQRNAWGGIPCITLPDETNQCFGQPAVPPPADPDDPELTLGQILTAVREMTLPALRINIQPGEVTLINLDTIFYTQPQPFRRSITLLDYDIDVVATPASYRWNHGDGTSHTTSNPGAAYPAKTVTHRYRKKAQNLTPSVDVTYSIEYRIDNSSWQSLGQTLTASGPTTNLDVKEATAVLSRY